MKTAPLLRGSFSISLVEVPTLSTSPNMAKSQDVVTSFAGKGLRPCAVSDGRVSGRAGSSDTVRAHTHQAGHSPNRSTARQRSVASQAICCPPVAQETRQYGPVASLKPLRMPIWLGQIAKTNSWVDPGARHGGNAWAKHYRGHYGHRHREYSGAGTRSARRGPIGDVRILISMLHRRSAVATCASSSRIFYPISSHPSSSSRPSCLAMRSLLRPR